MSINVTEVLTTHFRKSLKNYYHASYGHLKGEYAEIISWVAGIALELTARSDALFHDCYHCMQVSFVGQAMIRGMHIKKGGVSPEKWLHITIALLLCNIGFVRGICKEDDLNNNLFATGEGDEIITIPEGSTDAALAKYSSKRSQLFIKERFGNHTLINADEISKYMDLAIYPISKEYVLSDDPIANLVRSAQLVGQISHSRWLQRVAQLYYEYEENQSHKILGYTCPGDLKRHYPKYFWNTIYPIVKQDLVYLEMTQTGKQFLSLLMANVFTLEHAKNSENVISLSLQTPHSPRDNK
mmetsp:Transcript_10796/g.15810  ORF Transcript_10796/g.15810 Transcript_10796/m.15810 type:complete len:298 (+) Transcript_10796:38-931(+)